MKDPAFLFYSSDFLTGTMFMDNEQVGKYIRLMCAQHQKGRLTEKDMLHICKSYDEDIFNKFTKDSKGRYYSERLEIEIEKRKKYSESRRANRLKPKKENNISLSYDTSYVPHMENENEIIIDIKDKRRNKAFTPDFETLPEWMQQPLKLWFEYKKEKGEKYVSVGWNALVSKIGNEYANEKELSAAVHNSMANGWKGIFKPKNDEANKKSQSNPITDDLSNMDYSQTF